MRALSIIALALMLPLASYAAESEVTIKFNPQGGYGRFVPFPEIRNRNSLIIKLVRGMCLGTCPAYSIEIHGDGTIVYDGAECVAISGQRRARIDAAAIEKLYAAFRKADYFSLRDVYAAQMTDMPAYVTTLAFDGRSKTVTDYRGDLVGMPHDVVGLEDMIDEAAGTERWVYAGGRTCNSQPVDDSLRHRRFVPIP